MYSICFEAKNYRCKMLYSFIFVSILCQREETIRVSYPTKTLKSLNDCYFVPQVRLCFLNGNHYDSVYPIQDVKNAALCQCECLWLNSSGRNVFLKPNISAVIEFDTSNNELLCVRLCILQPSCTSCCTTVCSKWIVVLWVSASAAPDPPMS